MDSGRRIVVMGVAGSGKSTLGQLLAQNLACPFVEGDDEHPPANILKMRAGSALDDADRLPWLLRLQARIAAARHDQTSLVVSCSALKYAYRDLLRAGDPGLFFLHLHGNAILLQNRLAAREGHFMPASLLLSQLHDLEPLGEGENGMCLNFADTPEQLLRQIFPAPPGEI